ncbi:MAG: exodeoxyribonuclease III [Elusimicrobia bacterium]|nr:exodeoxyribonuclease III [Elusimicrobiota bacterium]
MSKKLLSWNVNGIRAAEKKGFLQWLYKERPDILAVQETKAHKNQLSEELASPRGYFSFWCEAQKKGYSGTAVFSAEKPIASGYGLGLEKFDSEGRIIFLEYAQFIFLNIYFPNGGMGPERLNFKLEFYGEFLRFAEKIMKTKKPLLVCGDFNTAHKEIDLARPKENENVSGFMPIERAWLDKFISAGLADTFRAFCGKPDQYSWWDLKTRARERNAGWRIDYFMASPEALAHVKDAFIMPKVLGSDHCPVGITYE